MKRLLYILFLLCSSTWAQETPEAFRPQMNRLTAFGKSIPQEKVYVHMDNTCYFQGEHVCPARARLKKNKNAFARSGQGQ